MSDQEMEWKAEGTRSYQKLAERSLNTMCEVEPLSEIGVDRKGIEFPDHVKPLVGTKAKNV